MALRGRWDFLEGVKAQTAAEAIVEEMAKVVADTLREFPPPLEFTDAESEAKFASLYAPGAARPRLEVLREGLRLACLEMDRDFEAIDFFVRNDHAGKVCDGAADRLALELTWKLGTEWMLELSERTSGKIRRPMLRRCLERASERLASTMIILPS